MCVLQCMHYLWMNVLELIYIIHMSELVCMYVPETLLLGGNNKYVKAYFYVCITNALNGMYICY